MHPQRRAPPYEAWCSRGPAASCCDLRRRPGVWDDQGCCLELGAAMRAGRHVGSGEDGGPCGHRRWCGRGARDGVCNLAASKLEMVTVTARVQAKVADLLEARREYVLHEAEQEAHGMQGLGLAVFSAKGHGVVADVDEPTVGDRDAMGVATEISEQVIGSAKGLLGVYAPGLVREAPCKSLASLRVAKIVVL